jgi:hypothetical protein
LVYNAPKLKITAKKRWSIIKIITAEAIHLGLDASIKAKKQA